MQAPRGMLFLQLSGAALILVATTLYQNRTALIPQETTPLTRRTTYERYESVLSLLETNRPAAAAALLTSFPEDKLGVNNALLKDQFADYSPAMLFLHIGKLLSRHAADAARSGSEHQARLLVDTCELLRQRLERGGRSDESTPELEQRLQVSRLLRQLTQRTEATITLYHSS